MRELLRAARHYAGNVRRLVTIPWRQHRFRPSEVRSVFGCSFGSDGWHHLVETLKEYRADSAIPWRATTLYAYHATFHPRNVFELAGHSVDVPWFVFPWGPFNIGLAAKDVWSSRFCGPSTDPFIEQEFERLVALYHRVRRTGYRPWSFGHGFVAGTVLTAAGGERRFVVLQGNHRVAALAVLDTPLLAVRTHPGLLLTEVREVDCTKWPLVRDGWCSPEAARAVFRMYFEQVGDHVRRIVKPGS